MDNKELLDPLLERGIPVAMIAREMPSRSVHTVVVDDFTGGVLAARNLLELGHTRIAVLAEQEKVVSSRERVRGFRQAMLERGQELPGSWVCSCNYAIEDGKLWTLELLRQSDRPTALFCCNDLLAIGAIQAARELSLRLPADLSVIGFDNTILASVTDPPLTTVAQPIDSMATTVVDLLIGQIKKVSSARQRIVLQPEIIVRASTAAPAAGLQK